VSVNQFVIHVPWVVIGPNSVWIGFGFGFDLVGSGLRRIGLGSDRCCIGSAWVGYRSDQIRIGSDRFRIGSAWFGYAWDLIGLGSELFLIGSDWV
jgi:hypothetical protein